jgi:N5-(carboxyethyl)ornithine synthase
MKTIAFLRPSMDEEKRIAILPEDVKRLKHPGRLFFESGYGRDLGIKDRDYLSVGSNLMVKENVKSLDVLCQPKFCDSDLERIGMDKTLFGWFHLTKESSFTKKLARKRATIFGWNI